MTSPTYRAGPNGEQYRQLASVDDVTPEVLTCAEEIFDGWFSNSEHIDWEDFLDRLEMWPGMEEWEISENDNPAVRKIKRHIRSLRNQM